MLSARGNPTMDNLLGIFCAVPEWLGMHLQVSAVK